MLFIYAGGERQSTSLEKLSAVNISTPQVVLTERDGEERTCGTGRRGFPSCVGSCGSMKVGEKCGECGETAQYRSIYAGGGRRSRSLDMLLAVKISNPQVVLAGSGEEE